jgi:peptidoglycan/LPS O-acetylase OafA/YrhL
MFGIYRWLLAGAVVLCHLAPWEYRYVGYYSVFAFFTLSGYIVSYILNTAYFGLPYGAAKYGANRLLRIFPLYWCVLAISWLLLQAAPTLGLSVHGLYQLPQTEHDWLVNLFAIGGTDINGQFNRHLINPSGWSLGVELIYWGLIPIFWRWKNLVALFITLTLLFLAMSLIDGREMLAIRYESPLGGAVPFLLGMGIFWYKTQPYPAVPSWLGRAAAAALLMLYVFASRWLADPYFEGFYAALALHGVLILYLSQQQPEAFAPALRRLDKFLGNLAYPIFLAHLPMALALYIFWPTEWMSPLSWPFFLIGLAFSNIMAVMLHAGIEAPIDRLRKRLKC